MNKRLIVLVGAGLLGISLLIILVIVSSSSGFKVNGYEPKGASPQPVAIVVKFNKPISTKNKGNVKVDPFVIGTSKIQGDTLFFYPNTPLANKRSYHVQVNAYTSSDNKKMKDLSFYFTVDTSLSRPASKAQIEASVAGTDSSSRNPIVGKLPYDNLTFKISAIINGDVGDAATWRDFKSNYFIKIETFAYKNPAHPENYKPDTLRLRQDALNWIKQQGVDPAKDINVYYVPDDQVIGVTPSPPADE